MLDFWRDAIQAGRVKYPDQNEGHPVTVREKALKPEDLTRLFVERANDADAAGIAALYEEQAVMAYPPGSTTVGREAIRVLWEKVLASAPRFEQEPPLPNLVSGDIALTSTPPKDGAGARAQVARRQPDGTWLRLLDQPEFVQTAP
jgi:ketosteroid isomerase-like protein